MGLLIAILKIIGIILLVILALLLAVICIVVFVPFVYRFQGEKYDKTKLETSVKWLFGILRIDVKISEDEPEIHIYIFGRRLGKKRKKRKKAKKEVKKTETSKNTEKAQAKDIKRVKVTTVNIDEKEENIEIQSIKKEHEQEKSEEQGKSKEQERNKEQERSKEQDKSKEQNKKTDKSKEKKETNYIAKYLLELSLEEKKEIVSCVFQFIKRIFKGISPDSIDVDLTVGTGDPATTGYILALAGASNGYFVNNRINIKGKFDEAFLEGKVTIAGNIKVGTFLGAVISLIIKKPIRKLIKTVWKGRGK